MTTNNQTPDSKPERVIDGARFSTLEQFYDEVERVLIPGTVWGRNLDAFNDILSGSMATPDGGFVLRWRQSERSRLQLGYPETVRQLEARKARWHPQVCESVDADLDRARRGEGPTVFDWLVEIIRDHGPGGEWPDDGVQLILE